jgi:hypothetical protein
MSRSGYSDDLGQQELARWRGAVESAIRGKRGQKLLREMKDALEQLPERRLISGELEASDGSGCVCALGAVGRVRGIDLQHLDPENRYQIAAYFDIAEALAAEVVFKNDEGGHHRETPEDRWVRVHAWVCSCITKPTTATDEMSNVLATPANDTREP